jgi:hypothetical protein
MRIGVWIQLALVFMCGFVRIAYADDPWDKKDLEIRVRSDLFLATQNAGRPAVVFRVPLPERAASPTLDGQLTDPIWSDATSIPLPYVRAGNDGRIVAEA